MPEAIINIAVLGAGAMGSVVGVYLARVGANITLLDVNDQHIEAINREGLTLTSDDGDHIVRLSAMRPEQLVERQDVIIVLTKQPHTRAAFHAMASTISETTFVLTLKNGLGNKELIEEFVPLDRILEGVTIYSADFLAPGHVRSKGDGELRIMTADGVPRPIADRLAALFNLAGHRCIVDPGVTTAIWSKVAFNCAMNSICALTYSTVGQLGSCLEARAVALAVVDDVAAVAAAIGNPVDGPKVKATIEEALDTQVWHRPSMLQDMLAKRPTEIESINGAVARIARDAQIPVPITSALHGLVCLAQETCMADGHR